MNTISTLKKSMLLACSSIFFIAASFAQCPTSSMPTNDCGYGDAIDQITIDGISATNAGCSGSGTGYTAFASPVWTFFLDSTYNMNVSLGGGSYNQGFAIWIDIDNDGFLTAAEQLYTSTNAALSQTGTITIPSTGAIGVPLKMRLMCAYNTNTIPAMNACTSNQGTYGETEDYQVILAAPVIPSNVSATAVINPVDNACGSTATELWVRVTNTTATDETNIPVVVNVSGMLTNSFNATIPSILGNTAEDILVATIDNEAGGILNVQFYTDFIDDDANDDTLVSAITIMNATALDLIGPTEFCEGELAIFTVTNPDMENYTWTLDGVTVGDTTSSFQSTSLTTAGQLVVSSDNNCRANDTLEFIINPLPSGSFTSSVSLNAVDFTGTASDFDEIIWDFGDGSGTGNGLNESYTYTNNGTYTVCMYAINQCDTLEFCDDVNISGVGLLELATGDIKVYPNPTSNVVTVSLRDMDGFKGEWSLVDLEGRQLEKGEISISSDKVDLNLMLGSYASGTYIFRLSNKHGQSYVVNLIRE